MACEPYGARWRAAESDGPKLLSTCEEDHAGPRRLRAGLVRAAVRLVRGRGPRPELARGPEAARRSAARPRGSRAAAAHRADDGRAQDRGPGRAPPARR